MPELWRGGKVWEALCKQVYREESFCYVCHAEVDVNLRGRTKWSRSVDHILPVDVYPHLALERSNLAICHYGCNSSKSAHGTVNDYESSREW